ncbi:response regulator transcription factor [Arcobacter sp. LA11]|uniref:response regulator transcription factor n=1 Tax=Arcobacter sp. LA11 TaxID=1898176 RepID=UPI0009325034|nr:response regulator transcription factor [Arcobacter sp. LA11]
MARSKLKDFKVLFVEDEEKIRQHIANSLSYLVEEVKEASNGVEALDVLESFTPDIIITDLEMPLMNGVDFIKHVREEDKDVCIIVLTAHTNNQYLLELIDMHIEHFIVKPMNFEKLLTILQKCEKSVLEQKSVKHVLPLDYSYDEDKKSLSYKNDEIRLTRKEILFLELLFKNSFRIVSYDEIDSYVWEDSVMTESSIRSLVKNLRKKLPVNLIENLSGVGYKLV